jgi:hypothetical protein
MSKLNNLVSVQIPPKDQAAIMQKLGELEVLLKPYLVALTAEERRVLPKMSDGNAPFVDKALQHAQANPTLAPAFLDVNELEVDLKAVDDLSKIFRKADMSIFNNQYSMFNDLSIEH